jgi:hypothetical protein
MPGLPSRRQPLRTSTPWRDFADARTLPGSFEPPAGLDPARRVLSGLAQAPRRHQVTLRIQATAEQIRARLPASVASIKSAAGEAGTEAGG